MVTYVALPYQAYQLSSSSLVVGLLGLAELCPLLVTAFLGGALADARDRRRMLLLTELSFAGTSIVLLVNATLASPQLWLLFVVAAVMAALDGLQRPSLEALIPRLVDRDELPAAAAVGMLRFTVGEIAGPALGGVLIAVVGLPLTYAFDVATFAASLVLLGMMRAAPPPVAGAKVSLHGILEGLATQRPGRCCWAPTRSTSWPCSSACPTRSSPPSPTSWAVQACSA
jgi:MFS family permease